MSILEDGKAVIPARIVCVRNRNNRKDWIAFICTDMSLSEEEIVTVYGKRWKIEVFFKTCKSMLNLGSECHSLSYDALTAHVSLVFIRYMFSGWSNGGRGNSGRNSGAPVSKVAHSENGIANNSMQVCVLLEEKTKKGGWKAKVKDTPGICGPIVNSSDVPADKKAGDEIKLKVTAVMGTSTNFRYEGA